MDKEIIVSFVVPVYNSENDLQRCIDSILGQNTEIYFEAIFINDGSKDRSLDILMSYKAKDSRVVVVNQQNSGVSNARNAGIEVAKGKYVAFVDSDDWIEPFYLENLYKAIDHCKDSLVIEGCTEEKISGIKQKKYLPGIYENTDFEALFSERKLNVMGVPWGKLYDLETIHKYNIKFEPNIMFCEDFLFMLSYLCYAKKIIFIDSVDYHYISKSGSLVSKYYSFEKEFLGFELQKTIWDRLISIYPELSKYKFWSAYLALRSIKTMYRHGNYSLSWHNRKENLRKFSYDDCLLLNEYGIIRHNKLALFISKGLQRKHIEFIDFVLVVFYKSLSLLKK